MAAKLKKRAMAELVHTQTVEETSASATIGVPSRKKLRLVLSRRARSNIGSASSVSSASAAAVPVVKGVVDETLSSLSRLEATRDVSAALAQAIPKIRALSSEELPEVCKRLTDILVKKPGLDANVRVQIVLCLDLVLSLAAGSGALTDSDAVTACEAVRNIVKEALEAWALWLRSDKSPKFVGALFGLCAKLPEYGVTFHTHQITKFIESAESHLTTGSHSLQANAVRMLGSAASRSEDAALHKKVLSLVGHFTQSPEPRMRKVAFEAMLQMHKSGRRLGVDKYESFCSALRDDFDGVRQVALRLVLALAEAYPEERLRISPASASSSTSSSPTGDSVRLVDDAFAKICSSMGDLSVQVRELAGELIGSMRNISQEYLEQTLDKKLMSNMRLKNSAHEREARMVTSGEWSSGKKWADDAPKEELDAQTVNLMAMGACGAFVHGLEDEFLSVRGISVDSLTRLSIGNPRLAALALDFLVDMFNDEIELVRLKAIESLRLIAPHISLQINQLETILSALDDFSIVVRERLHCMLQASTIANKDGLQSVISKLLENLKKYPQDRRSILLTFKRIGERHAELTLPLVTQLLEIHPFFDTAEPDIDDPAYLSILVLVFNAAQHCPTLQPLLDQHTNRHYHYLIDTYPNLIPATEEQTERQCQSRTNTVRFLRETLARIADSEHISAANRIKLLERGSRDLERLSSIDPQMADASRFAHLYLRCQTLLLKTLDRRFWSNPRLLPAQERGVIETNISSLFDVCLQLKHRFSGLSSKRRRQLQLLKIQISALHLIYVVKASNKSALTATDLFLDEIDQLMQSFSDEDVMSSSFMSNLVKRLSEAEDAHKPGVLVRLLQPLLPTHPLESLDFETNDEVTMAHAVIYEPTGNSDMPLNYTAGMILAVPVDCEVLKVRDVSLVRLAIRTPDQKVQLVTPKPSQFFALPEANCYRLMTEALMSHPVWTDAVHVEISVVLDMSSALHAEDEHSRSRSAKKSLVSLCTPVKVYVQPKAVKRGL